MHALEQVHEPDDVAEAPSEQAPLEFARIDVGVITFHIRGRTPFICHRVSEAAQRELLLPHGQKTKAERAQTIKHNPREEFRDSCYRRRPSESGPTRLLFPATSFKGALMTAALETPGVTKAQISRLVWVEGRFTDLYGIPELWMDVVRPTGSTAPDVRTRAFLPRWASTIAVRFVRPTLTAQAVFNLLCTAGIIVGIGDFRQEKGKGNYGQFEVVEPDDPEYLSIIKNGGMAAQDAALREARPHDLDSENLLAWYDEELRRRGRTEKEEPK